MVYECGLLVEGKDIFLILNIHNVIMPMRAIKRSFIRWGESGDIIIVLPFNFSEFI